MTITVVNLDGQKQCSKRDRREADLLQRRMESGRLTIQPDYTLRVTSPAYIDLDGRKLPLSKNRKDWPQIAG